MLTAMLAFLMLEPPPRVALVGTLDDRPTETVAEGFASHLAPVRQVAEKCGFSRTWVWDDDTSAAELWVLGAEVTPRRTACLRRWQRKHPHLAVSWKLPPLSGK